MISHIFLNLGRIVYPADRVLGTILPLSDPHTHRKRRYGSWGIWHRLIRKRFVLARRSPCITHKSSCIVRTTFARPWFQLRSRPIQAIW